MSNLNSAELAARLELNPHNLPGITDAPAMSPHDYWAARFEAEGHAAYPTVRHAPYNAGTMAHTRWLAGFNAAAGADPDTWEARRAAYRASLNA